VRNPVGRGQKVELLSKRPSRLTQVELRLSGSIDFEFFRKAAFLTQERELLESAWQQNWRDTGNNHFRSALRTRRLDICVRNKFPADHVFSFRSKRDAETKDF
jgi:hypothetical protein